MSMTQRIDRQTLLRATRTAEARLAYTMPRRPAPGRPDRQATDEAAGEEGILGR